MNSSVNQLVDHRTLLKLSELSYRDGTRKILKEKNWKSFKHYSDNDTGFSGTGFVNEDLRAVVIAFRGTTSLVTDWTVQDWTKNNVCFATGCVPEQFEKAKNFVISCSRLFRNFTKFLTGHSLGGGLAQLVAIKENIPAISFDAPGTLHPAKSLFTQSMINERSKNIVAYVSSVNLVNTSGEHIVDLIKLENLSTITECRLSYFSFTLSLHQLSTMDKHFDKNTGKPVTPKHISRRSGWFKGHEEFKEMCDKEIKNQVLLLNDCPNVLVTDHIKQLLKEKISFYSNKIQVTTGFTFLKKDFACDHELDLYGLISTQLYEDRLRFIKHSKANKIINELAPFAYKEQIVSDSHSEENSLVDVYSVSVSWHMNARDINNYFNNIKATNVCNEYLCETLGLNLYPEDL